MKFYSSSQFFERNQVAFEDIRSEVQSVLPSARVEHVGASAISGLISKGDLDVFVGVDLQEFDEAVSKLKLLGCREKQDTLRTGSLCMLVVERYEWDAAIQLVANGSEYEFFLKFRDKLAESPNLVEQYNKLKAECTGMKGDEYREVKSRFIEEVLFAP